MTTFFLVLETLKCEVAIDTIFLDKSVKSSWICRQMYCRKERDFHLYLASILNYYAVFYSCKMELHRKACTNQMSSDHVLFESQVRLAQCLTYCSYLLDHVLSGYLICFAIAFKMVDWQLVVGVFLVRNVCISVAQTCTGHNMQ